MAPLDTDAVRRQWHLVASPPRVLTAWDGPAADVLRSLCDEVDRLRAALAEIADGGCVCPVQCEESDPCDPMRARQALDGADQ